MHASHIFHSTNTTMYRKTWIWCSKLRCNTRELRYSHSLLLVQKLDFNIRIITVTNAVDIPVPWQTRPMACLPRLCMGMSKRSCFTSSRPVLDSIARKDASVAKKKKEKLMANVQGWSYDNASNLHSSSLSLDPTVISNDQGNTVQA